jgi:hypothetical protein
MAEKRGKRNPKEKETKENVDAILLSFPLSSLSFSLPLSLYAVRFITALL